MRVQSLLHAAALPSLALVLLGGCAVGPDFRAPGSPPVSGYTARPLPSTITGGPGVATQTLAAGESAPSHWWTRFQSPALNTLVSRALADSPTVASREAALRQSEDILASSTDAAVFPSVTGRVGAERERTSPASFGIPNASANEFNLYNAGVNVSYGLDLFGGARRALEGLRAQVDYSRYEAQAARLTLIGNVVTAAIRNAALTDEVAATQAALATETRALAIMKTQLADGAISRLDLIAEEQQVATTEASLPPLELALAQNHHALAVLVGAFPEQAVAVPSSLAELHLPTHLPVSLPSQLVANRPDIEAATALLHAANANIGVTTAAELPTLTLSGAYGWAATSPGALFSPATALWNLGAGIATPIFDGGALRANRRAAGAAYDEASANYRATVLAAFQNVADVLRALVLDGTALDAATTTASTATERLHITQAQHRFGGASLLGLLDAERQAETASLSLIQAQASRYADTAALFQALGGRPWDATTPNPAAGDTRAATRPRPPSGSESPEEGAP